jgi:putative oxidoreductase
MSVFQSTNRFINRLGDNTQTLAWTLMRILASAMFMTHGWAKLFGERAQPMFGGMDFFGINLGINMLWIAGVIELFVAGLVAVGLFTRIASLLCAVLMIMAYLSAHPAWFPTLNNGELAAMYFLVYLVLFSFGGGKLSLDSMLRR